MSSSASSSSSLSSSSSSSSSLGRITRQLSPENETLIMTLGWLKTILKVFQSQKSPGQPQKIEDELKALEEAIMALQNGYPGKALKVAITNLEQLANKGGFYSKIPTNLDNEMKQSLAKQNIDAQRQLAVFKLWQENITIMEILVELKLIIMSLDEKELTTDLLNPINAELAKIDNHVMQLINNQSDEKAGNTALKIACNILENLKTLCNEVKFFKNPHDKLLKKTGEIEKRLKQLNKRQQAIEKAEKAAKAEQEEHDKKDKQIEAKIIAVLDSNGVHDSSYTLVGINSSDSFSSNPLGSLTIAVSSDDKATKKKLHAIGFLKEDQSLQALNAREEHYYLSADNITKLINPPAKPQSNPAIELSSFNP